MRNRKGEIATILTIGTLVVIGVTAVISSLGLNQKKSTNSRAAMTCPDNFQSCGAATSSDCCDPSTQKCSAGKCVALSASDCAGPTSCTGNSNIYYTKAGTNYSDKCISKKVDLAVYCAAPTTQCEGPKTCSTTTNKYWVKSGAYYSAAGCSGTAKSLTTVCPPPTQAPVGNCTTGQKFVGTNGYSVDSCADGICKNNNATYAGKQGQEGTQRYCCCTPNAPIAPTASTGKGCGSGGGWACDPAKGYDKVACPEEGYDFNCCYKNGNKYGCVGTFCSAYTGGGIVPCNSIAQPTQPAGGGGTTPTGNPQDRGDACCIAYRPDMYGCGGGTNKIVYYSHSLSTYGMTSCEKYNKDTSTMLYFTCKDGAYTEGQCVSVWGGGLSIDDKNNAINNLYPTAVPEDPTPPPAAGCQRAPNGAECRYIDEADANNTYIFSNGQCCPKAAVVAPTAGAAGAGCNPGQTATCTDKVTTYTYYKSKSTTCSAGTELNKPCYGVSSTSCEAYTWGELANNKCKGAALPTTVVPTKLTTPTVVPTKTQIEQVNSGEFPYTLLNGNNSFKCTQETTGCRVPSLFNGCKDDSEKSVDCLKYYTSTPGNTGGTLSYICCPDPAKVALIAEQKSNITFQFFNYCDTDLTFNGTTVNPGSLFEITAKKATGMGTKIKISGNGTPLYNTLQDYADVNMCDVNNGNACYVSIDRSSYVCK